MPQNSSALLRLAWCSSKVERRQTDSTGCGIYANTAIPRGELVIVWGGAIVTTKDLYELPVFARDRAIQVDEDHHLCSGMIDHDADCVNHSCDPNAGLRGQISLVTMRDVVAGDQICFDYAMSDTHPEFVMDCGCGSPLCRGKITGEDWKSPELQARYNGYFSPYIQVQIDRLRAR